MLCFKSNESLYVCDATVSNIYSCLVFLGEGYLALVPLHLPHLRKLCLTGCDNVRRKYVFELLAEVPELRFIM